MENKSLQVVTQGVLQVSEQLCADGFGFAVSLFYKMTVEEGVLTDFFWKPNFYLEAYCQSLRQGPARISGRGLGMILMFFAVFWCRTTVEEGGETVFPNAADKVTGPEWSECAKAGLAVKTRKGDALFFYRQASPFTEKCSFGNTLLGKHVLLVSGGFSIFVVILGVGGWGSGEAFSFGGVGGAGASLSPSVLLHVHWYKLIEI